MAGIASGMNITDVMKPFRDGVRHGRKHVILMGSGNSSATLLNLLRKQSDYG
jgi:hypothetical protein